MARVYVSIGSNIEREHNVRSGVRALEQRYGPLRLSPVYACPAVGFEGDEFFNLVASFETDESAQAVDEALHAIEYQHGRVRGAQRFAPRTLDLDILTYDDLILHEGRLRLPRGEITRYAFVLKPLADLAPDARHPELGTRYAELWAEFDAREQPLAVVDFPLP